MNDEQSDELSPQARTLLEVGRDADLPSANDRARVRTKLALQLAGAAAGAAAGKATAQLAVGSKVGAGTFTGKALLAVAVLGVVGVGASVALRSSHDASDASRPARVERTLQASEPGPSPVAGPAQLGAAPSVPEATSAAPARPTPPSARAPAAHAAPRNVDHDWAADLQAEVSLLAQAQRALAAGDPDAALEHLAQHRAQFPKGALNQERRAASAIAHCQAGRLARGRALLADLPEDSPLSARAEETCRGDAR